MVAMAVLFGLGLLGFCAVLFLVEELIYTWMCQKDSTEALKSPKQEKTAQHPNPPANPEVRIYDFHGHGPPEQKLPRPNKAPPSDSRPPIHRSPPER